MTGGEGGEERYENVGKTEDFTRRLDRKNGMIESVCLHCYATICSATDVSYNNLREALHSCAQKHDPKKAQSA